MAFQPRVQAVEVGTVEGGVVDGAIRNLTGRGDELGVAYGTADGLRIKLQRVDLFNAQSPFEYVLQIWV